MSLPAIVLAAGASRRLGQPKQLVRIEGETLLERTIRIVRGTGGGPVCVVLGAHADRILSEAALTNVFVVRNEGWEQGMASSIRAGIDWFEEHVKDASGVMLLVCDQPRLTLEHLNALIARFDETSSAKVVASSYAGIRGVPAIFPRAAFAKLMGLQGDQGARRLLQALGSDATEVAFESAATDIDTPEELTSYLAEIRGAPSARGRGRS